MHWGVFQWSHSSITITLLRMWVYMYIDIRKKLPKKYICTYFYISLLCMWSTLKRVRRKFCTRRRIFGEFDISVGSNRYNSVSHLDSRDELSPDSGDVPMRFSENLVQPCSTRFAYRDLVIRDEGSIGKRHFADSSWVIHMHSTSNGSAVIVILFSDLSRRKCIGNKLLSKRYR